MKSKVKTFVFRNITNARGWTTNRKIVVIESDDWGSKNVGKLRKLTHGYTKRSKN